ncbi:MAG: DUF2283 domain-containing protein [Chloroflexi bacterium]|nr:DUF2283 domain-containing protein [Chloroflexota bacterium]
MDLRYDATLDCAYILLEPARIVSTRRLPGSLRMIDYDGLGRPVGVILRQLSLGVDLNDLPFAEEIAALLETIGVAVSREAQPVPAAIPQWYRSERRDGAQRPYEAAAVLRRHKAA